ncbi:NADP-dependent malic enzyme [Sideroxydans lithotrophicus]|uniref:Malate dehydrogenase (Oxaloacetate-decarboxylating) (NADP(+))., Phosphate acetyltransferase n=1 Tax=Sideroxydans lithotrophicus (strain ES-1) TaxID=580332 RepID=D5CM77_SIDLE|nr:NADP-dependent malic enzyme [Sideroxydans lithotrophicus]ADE10691.1 Malate dehydrogenase (oxaloacetate-decarboxylating) (NADP(+))., Phosphate acetyltransferase [Sideroxydans lithotrophicus ES-1]
MDKQLREAALQYHRQTPAGKISVRATKPMITQRDLALAYSPGVAAACELIVADPAEVRNMTARGNLVAVISNGTAVLGLGAIGPLAAKPVMEGKGVLFKKFAGIDVFDLEIDERDPDRLVEIIAALEPTFGGINLEDIKAPECFYIERKLRERMHIPVFHDDQHGTSIIVGAALLNGLKVVGKKIEEIKLVVSGAGAAALACLDMLVCLGVKAENIIVTDIKGVVYKGRTEEMDDNKARYAVETAARTLGEVIAGADAFLGLSAGGVLKSEMVKQMADKPLIFALANPTPEILPELAKAARPDAIMATGRSDYPNQVNNALCFPYIFRGALDVGATNINEAMKLAAVYAIAELAQAEQSDTVAEVYGEESLSFGPEYLIPKPFDPRLITRIAPAVAQAAMDSGVAARPIADMDAYREQLSQFIYHSNMLMKPVFSIARKFPKRLAYAEGEDERVLHAVQTVVDEGIAYPILVGRPAVIEQRIARLGLRIRAGEHFELVNPESDSRYREYCNEYHRLMQRHGVTPDAAKRAMRSHNTLIAAMLVRMDAADAMLCGTVSQPLHHLRYIDEVIGRHPGASVYAAMNILMLPGHTLFICDTHVNLDPTAEEVAAMTLLAAAEVRRFGLTPKVALLSHSNFGSHKDASAQKMSRARELLEQLEPELEVEGEMHGDAALSESLRNQTFPASRMKGNANLLIMPNLDAANIAYNLLKITGGEGITIGSILLGANRSVHILTSSATVRRLVNMSALAVAGVKKH